MKAEEFDWRGGRIASWELGRLEERRLADQLDYLTEDLAQIEYQNGRLIDVGWFPDKALNGEFHIVVVSGADWDRPVFSASAGSLADLRVALARAIISAASASSR